MSMYEKQVKNSIINSVSSNGITQAVSQNINNISNFLGNKARNIEKERQKELELNYNSLLLDTTSSLSNSMHNSYNNFSDDPKKLTKDFEETKNKLASGLSDEMKLEIEKQYLTLKNNLLLKANDNYRKKLDFQNRDSILSFANSKIGSAQVYYDNMFNGTLTPETIADYQINREVINKTLLQTGTKGQNLIKEAELLKIEKSFNKAKIDSALNYFNGLFESNQEEFLFNFDKWEQQPLTIQQEYNLKPEEYNKITNYAEKLRKSLEDDKKDDIYNIRKTTQQKIVDATILTELDSRYKFFNIKNKNGKFKVQNSDLNNVESVIDFRNAVKEARANNNINNTQYKNFLSNTALALNEMMGKNGNLKSSEYLSATAGEQINNKIKDFFKENEEVYIDDRVFFYENAFNMAKENNINLHASDSKSLEKINNIMDTLKNQYIQDRFVSLKEKTNAVIFGNNIISYDKKAGTVGNKNLDSGRIRKRVNGEDFWVVLDDNGKIIQAFDMNNNEVKVK